MGAQIWNLSTNLSPVKYTVFFSDRKWTKMGEFAIKSVQTFWAGLLILGFANFILVTYKFEPCKFKPC